MRLIMCLPKFCFFVQMMHMKNTIFITLIILAGLGCQQPTKSTTSATTTNIVTTQMSTRAPFIHTVFFYLNDDVTAEQKTQFEGGMQKLGTCPTIANFRIGKPAMTPRDIVDNDYGYSWIVEFKNAKDQDAYQTEPIHLAFIEEFKDLWKEVKVYDSVMMN